MRKHIQDTWRSLKADSLQWHQPIVAVSGGSNAQRDLSDLLSSLRCAALHLDSVSGMLSPPLLQPVAVQSLKAFWWAWQCDGLFLFYTKGWSYASFEGNSLLCNQTPLFHNHSTLTVAHPLHSTRSDQTEKHTYKYGALPAVAWFFIQLGMCTIVWLVFWNLFEHKQKMRPLFWRPQWLLKLEIPQQFSCQWGFQDPRHRQGLLMSGWILVECSYPESVFLF